LHIGHLIPGIAASFSPNSEMSGSLSSGTERRKAKRNPASKLSDQIVDAETIS